MFISRATVYSGRSFFCILLIVTVMFFSGCAPIDHVHSTKVQCLEQRLEQEIEQERQPSYSSYRIKQFHPPKEIAMADKVLFRVFEIIKIHSEEVVKGKEIGVKSKKLKRDMLLNVFVEPNLEYIYRLYGNNPEAGGQAIKDLINYVYTGDKRFRKMGTEEHEVAGLFVKYVEKPLRRILRGEYPYDVE